MSKYEDKDYEQIGYEQERGRQRYIEEQKNKKIKEDNKLTLPKHVYIIIGLMLVLFLIGLILDFLLAIPFWVYLTVFSVIVIRILSVAKISEQLSLKLQKPNQKEVV